MNKKMPKCNHDWYDTTHIGAEYRREYLCLKCGKIKYVPFKKKKIKKEDNNENSKRRKAF